MAIGCRCDVASGKLNEELGDTLSAFRGHDLQGGGLRWAQTRATSQDTQNRDLKRRDLDLTCSDLPGEERVIEHRSTTGRGHRGGQSAQLPQVRLLTGDMCI